MTPPGQSYLNSSASTCDKDVRCLGEMEALGVGGGGRAYSSETRLLHLGGAEEGESTFQEWFYSDDSALGILPQ